MVGVSSKVACSGEGAEVEKIGHLHGEAVECSGVLDGEEGKSNETDVCAVVGTEWEELGRSCGEEDACSGVSSEEEGKCKETEESAGGSLEDLGSIIADLVHDLLVQFSDSTGESWMSLKHLVSAAWELGATASLCLQALQVWAEVIGFDDVSSQVFFLGELFVCFVSFHRLASSLVGVVSFRFVSVRFGLLGLFDFVFVVRVLLLVRFVSLFSCRVVVSFRVVFRLASSFRFFRFVSFVFVLVRVVVCLLLVIH